ncbi:response regulator [Zafaria sp. Z1313]|uniref:response regulator transcription factor n=1 Tax=unclassified Zafaria TaxID=2828765 RepID=UPI002E7670D4|nr:response regulator transcription factor [Zafaria sp. J156]MEE1621655.1 response regulator transcription factor [Zafaria sp. J156]
MGELGILIVDDEPLQRQALSMIVGGSPGFRVVGEAADGRAAVEGYLDHGPDVVLMDLMMPRMNGVEASQRLMRLDPRARIVVMTSLASEQFLVPALAAGACGYLTKDVGAEEILDALRGAAAGDLRLSATVTRNLVQLAVRNFSAETTADPRAAAPDGGDPAVRVTAREQSVLDLLARGLSNAEIGQELYLSEATVKANLARVMMKLGAQNRVQTLIKAVRLGLVDLAEGGPATSV